MMTNKRGAEDGAFLQIKRLFGGTGAALEGVDVTWSEMRVRRSPPVVFQRKVRALIHSAHRRLCSIEWAHTEDSSRQQAAARRWCRHQDEATVWVGGGETTTASGQYGDFR